MARNSKYILFLIIVGALLLFILRKEIYRSLIVENKQIFPSFIENIINNRINRRAESLPTYKAEETIKILEGWTVRGISQYFEELGKWQSEELLELVGFPQTDYRDNKEMSFPKDFSANFQFLKDKPKYYGLEGYLFPDTYKIYSDATLEEVVVKMLQNFDDKLTPKMRADIEKQGKTIYEIVTMASIIEKEAPIINSPDSDNKDAKIISGIFWDRLKVGQALQSDATLSYIFGDNKPGHSGKELEVDSPYNTYKYRGLPPSPICNPGIVALEAAIYPIKTTYNYFLTPSDSKEVIYADTYEQHLANKYKYLK